MSTMQEDLVTLLKPIAPIAPMTMAQSTPPPYIVYQRLSSNTQNIMDGNGSPPINNTRLQLDAWATTYAGAQALAASIRAAMQGWSYQNVQKLEMDEYDQDVKQYRVLMDYSIWHYN